MSASNTDTGDTKVVDSNSEFASAIENPTAAPREALITTAISFLQNAKVRNSTLLQKQQFLRSKGLTMEEIQIACERAGVFTQDPNNPQTTAVINMGISSETHSRLALQPRQSPFGRIREALHSMALLSGFVYAIYVFWKKYLAPFLFGKKKRKPIDESLEDIEKKVDTRINDVSRELTQLKESLSQQQRDQAQQFNREFKNFHSDLEAIKGLLLNRKQFAAPVSNVVGRSSIPAWQLAASSSTHHHRHHSQSDDNEKPDDAGSGSGSSETEVVTKNSDSSLEIM